MSFLIALVMALAPVIVTSSTDYPSNNNNNSYNTVFWVAPTLEDCQGRTPCNTLTGYQYTASNSIWVFLQGRHYVSTSVVVEGVSNVTWIGEELCYDEEQRCSIHFDNSLLENGSDHKYYLHFKSSRLIAIKHLKFTSSHATSPTFFSIEDTHNCLLHSVTISEGCGLSVSDSTGYLNITNSLFRDGIHYFMNSSIQPRRMSELMVNIIHSQFYDSELILELMEEATSYTMITVSITSSTFVGKTSQLTVKVFGFPDQTFSITVRHSLFTYSQSAVTVNSTIVVSDSSSVLQMPVICMENVTITEGSSALTLLASYEVLSNMSCVSLYPQIIVSNCNFLLSGDMANRNNVRLVHAVLNYTELDKNHLYHCSAVDTGRRPLLVFTGTSIISNSICSGIIYAEGFFWHHVSFGGDVVFRNNSCNVIQLQNSLLEIHGYNEIHSNNGEGIILSPSSQLLFSNNSELSIRNNKVPINGSGVHIEPTGDDIESFSEFVQCYIHKTVCPGWCFFQFIHSNGSAVSGEELTTFTASLNISGNTYDAGKYSNVLNGHISNCFLKTSNGQTLLNPSVRMRFIRVEDDIESINMIPYQICLCDHTQPYKGEYCNQTTVIEIYPHQMVNLQVRVLKDLMIPVEIELLVFIRNSTRRKRVASTCTGVLSTVVSKNSRQIAIILQTTPLRAGLEGYTVNHTVMLRKQSCPIGTLEKRSGPGCECSPHLLKGGFICSHKNHTLIIKATHRYSWLGMYEGKLMFSRFCSYCNSALEVDISNHRVTDNQQCKYGQQGLLCRECPSGTSRTFGAKECHADCSNWWLLMIPLYALGGILLIVMLFVFNLTVMEGTINGAIFYTTIVWTVDGFTYKYVWPPFSAFDSALRFSFGISICLYEGMDRFAKVLLYYAFPIYLLVLVVLIIVSAHKLRLRIFTVPVISRRAVPVLATLMFITYHKLTMCVSQGLAFATIQNAETGEWSLHWKYQPTLLYFRGEHIALGVLSLLVKMLYLLPFTAVMLFGDLLRMCIRSLWFSHFLDVFHGAYRYPFGFWFGLRLLLRGVLIILREFMPLLSYSHFDFITTLAIGTLWFIQIAIKPFRIQKHPIKVHCTGKYKLISRMWKSFLSLQPSHFDSLFIMNSLVISVAALHEAFHEAIPWLYTIIVNGSLALAIAEFIAIMIYHWKMYFYIPKWLKKRIPKWLKMNVKKLLKGRRRSKTRGNAVPVDDTAVHAIPIMTLELPPHNNTSSDDVSDQVDSDDSNQVDMYSDDSNQMDTDSDSDVTRTMTSDLFCGGNTTVRDSLTEHLLK